MAFGSWIRKYFDGFKQTVGGLFSITTTNYLELYIRQGRQHYIREYHADIPVGGQKYYLIRFGEDPSIVKIRLVVTDSNNVFYRVYYNADISDDGTPIPIENFNEEFQMTPQAVCFQDPTVVSTGTYEIERWLPGAVDVGNRSTGEYQTEGLDRIVQGDRVALIEFDNQGDATVRIEYLLSWYEGPILPLGDQVLIP